jgi:predicted NBD/HSP70 family sugar kinase
MASGPAQNRARVLVIDIGGTHVMVANVRKAAARWAYSRVSIGYPGPVVHGKPVSEPHNLGPGWVGFNFRKAFGRPVKLVNKPWNSYGRRSGTFYRSPAVFWRLLRTYA